MKVIKAEHLDVLHVVENMSAPSREEVSALTRAEDDVLAAAIVKNFGPLCLVGWRDNPVVVFGATESERGGVWETFMFATDELDRVILPLTKFIKRDLIPYVREQGAHRVETKALSSHLPALRWLRSLGAVIEGNHPGYGRNREAFTTLAWVF